MTDDEQKVEPMNAVLLWIAENKVLPENQSAEILAR
jgi:hypothetical protein